MQLIQLKWFSKTYAHTSVYLSIWKREESVHKKKISNMFTIETSRPEVSKLQHTGQIRFASKVLLEHSYVHSFTHCIWWGSYHSYYLAHKASNIYYLVFSSNNLPTPVSEDCIEEYLHDFGVVKNFLKTTNHKLVNLKIKNFIKWYHWEGE